MKPNNHNKQHRHHSQHRQQRPRTATQEVKQRARRTLHRPISKDAKVYVVDTSAAGNRFISGLVRNGKIKGKLIIPNAVMAELENLANKGVEEGFLGLEDIAKLHHLKKQHNLVIFFDGIRPTDSHIKYAKSGEVDALIREIAFKNKAVLVTADLVQAKSAQAYDIEVLFLKARQQEPKPERKKFSFFGR